MPQKPQMPQTASSRGSARLSAREVAGELGVNPKTVTRWIKSGRLKAAQPGGPGGKFLVRASEAERLWNEIKDSE